MKSNLTIFANFYIDNEERLLRMKDSLESMKGILFDRYVVNVRGSFANQAVDYLKCNIKPLFVYSLESKNGWFFDTSKLLHLIKTPYVLIWMEDHICMSPETINDVVSDMKKSQADILTHTFWQNGRFLKRYSKIDQIDIGTITWFEHTVYLQKKFKLNSYLIAYPSIIKRNIFEKIINHGNEGPWSKFTPFNFEKPPNDIKWLPLKRANPKRELFAAIDDNHGDKIDSSLQGRGLYPRRVRRQSYARQKNSAYLNMFKTLIRFTWGHIFNKD